MTKAVAATNTTAAVSSQTIYWLGWMNQLNIQAPPAVGNIYQSWIAPRWIAADASQYAVYLA